MSLSLSALFSLIALSPPPDHSSCHPPSASRRRSHLTFPLILSLSVAFSYVVIVTTTIRTHHYRRRPQNRRSLHHLPRHCSTDLPSLPSVRPHHHQLSILTFAQIRYPTPVVRAQERYRGCRERVKRERSVREGRERRELAFSSPPSSSPPFCRLPPQFVVPSSLSPFTVSPVVGRKGANAD